MEETEDRSAGPRRWTPDGVSPVLWGDVSPASIVLDALNRHDDRTCLVVDEKAYSYAEFRQRVSKVMQALVAIGVTPEKCAGLLSGNSEDVAAVLVASTLLGIPRFALNSRGSVEDHAFMIEDSDAKFLLFDPSTHDTHAQGISNLVPDVKLFALGHSDLAPDFNTFADSFDAQELVLLAALDQQPDDLATRSYSGGTTGRPKGILATNRTILWTLLIQMAEWDWPIDTRSLVVTPLSHSGSALMYPTWIKGGTLVLTREHFSAESFIAIVERERISATLVVPTMIYTLLDSPALRDADLSSLENVFYGAALTSPTRLGEAIDRFGPVFFQFYGQAEAPLTVCTLRKEEHDRGSLTRLATCGRPVSWLEVALLDDDGNRVPAGDHGEICVRGPLVFAGYNNLPEENAQALKHGWLHTGDVAWCDEEGYFTIVDRKKDMIITGGFNVYPREVEDVLTRHPQVSEAAVFGVADDHWGEAVHAAVVVRAGATVTESELIGAVRDAKGPVQAPKSVHVVRELPLTAVGKVDKKALRAAHGGVATR